MKFLSEKNYRLFFDVGVLIKAILTVLEIILGVLFYAVSNKAVNDIVFFLLGNEATERPTDIVWNYFIHGFSGVSATTQAFWAFIFLSHGIAKIIFVIGLLKHKLWAYPLAALVFLLFIIYQTYYFILSPSFFLAVVTLFDALLIFVIMHEYTYRKLTLQALK